MTAVDMDSPPPPPPKETIAIEISGASGSNIQENQPRIILPDSSDMSSLTPLELHQLTQNMLDETASVRPYISQSQPISVLRSEYENGSGSFVKQIDYLQSNGFTSVRRTRGDGDCFYRSLGFAWIERLLNSWNQTVDVAKAVSLLDQSLLILKAAGFQELVYEDFYDVLTSIIRQIVVPEPGGSTLTSPILLEAFQDAEVSNCIVMYLRLLTSATIRIDPDSYAPFLFHPETGDEILPQEFCERYVEATGKEADHVQITALTRALKVNIRVAYLDGHDTDGNVNFVDFQSVPPEDFQDPPVLLYRPGHYDILETILTK